MAISVKGGANPGGVLTTAFGAGQGRRRNSVQDRALAAMENRKAQRRSINAQQEAQRRSIEANRRSQERAFEESDQDRNFAEKSRRRAARKLAERQTELQDTALKGRQESQRRGFEQQDIVQKRGFEQQETLQETAERNRQRAITEGREYSEGLLEGQREYQKGLLTEQREYNEQQGERDIANEQRRHTVAQKRRLADLASQEARIQEDPNLSEDDKQKAMDIVKQNRYGIKPVPQKPKELTFEQQQKQDEFKFKQKQEYNKNISSIINEGVKMFTDKETGKLDRKAFDAYKTEMKNELGLGATETDDPFGGAGEFEENLNTFSLDMTQEQMGGQSGRSAIPKAMKVLESGSRMDSSSRKTAIKLLTAQARAGSVESKKALLEYRERMLQTGAQ